MTKTPQHQIRCIILGVPRTKKNTPRAFAVCPKNCQGQQFNLMLKRRGVKPPKPFVNLLPSEIFEIYEIDALNQLKQWGNQYTRGPVIVTAYYWLKDRRSIPDLIGLYQATGDILERAGLIENDKFIIGFGDTKIMGFDKEQPRAELIITEYEGESIWK